VKKKILITGSCGFIMSNLLRNATYRKAQYDLIGVDRVSSSLALNSIYANKAYQFYVGDITDEHFINVLFEMERPDIVLHAAAHTDVDESFKQSIKYVQSNVVGTQVLVNAAIKFGVEKFVYVGTDECYGALQSETEPLWTESSPTVPRNPYSSSKLCGEIVAQTAYRAYSLPVCTTRCSNNYGPRQVGKLIPTVIKCILEKKPIPIYGKGAQIRSWIYVLDHCSALMSVIEKGIPGEIYNICTGQEFSNLEVVQKICNILGGHELITFIEDPRISHDFRYGMESDKIRELGWNHEMKFNDGIRICCDWYKANRYLLK
jgi:dTDP-glucose 4,6-dehydratase